MIETDSFERAFIAVSYLLGRREALLEGLAAPGDAARRTAARLSAPSQAERARRLAAELGPIVLSLEARRPS